MRKTVITASILVPVLAVVFVLAMRWLEPQLIYFPGQITGIRRFCHGLISGSHPIRLQGPCEP